MRKLLFLCSTVVFGLMMATSASGGFLATNAKVKKIASNYSGGSVNKFSGTSMVTSATNFTTSGAYSQALGVLAGGYNVYLVAPTATTFSVNFTDEGVGGVAASNGSLMLTPLLNVLGTHSSLSAAVKAAVTELFGTSSNLFTSGNFFGAGSNAIEIQGASRDSYSSTLMSVSGVVNSPFGAGFNGGGEISLVFTAASLSVVPEPTSLGLFGIGTLVFGFARSRRKKV